MIVFIGVSNLKDSKPKKISKETMENILWFLLIGGLFFLMHKMGLGCCGGHSHAKGHEKHHEDEKDTKKLAEEKRPSKM